MISVGECSIGISRECGNTLCEINYPNSVGSCVNSCETDNNSTNGIDDTCGTCVVDFVNDCECAFGYTDENEDANDGYDYKKGRYSQRSFKLNGKTNKLSIQQHKLGKFITSYKF